jgi:hypothetical protein
VAAFGKVETWWMKVLENKKNAINYLWMAVVALLFTAICIGSITSSSFNPFIYFRF